MIPESGFRFPEKIMVKKEAEAIPIPSGWLQPPPRISRIEVCRLFFGPPTSPGGTGCLIEAVDPLSLGMSKPPASTVSAA